jgi:signal transduction histidine kinase
LNPVRDKIQKVVDESLFVARIHFRNIVREISEQLRKTLSADELFQTMIAEVSEHVQTEAIAAYETVGDGLRSVATRGGEFPQNIRLPARVSAKAGKFNVYVTAKSAGTKRGDVDAMEEAWLQEYSASVAVPVLSERRNVLGMVFLRPPARVGSYEEIEIDILIEVAAVAGEVLERLKLQERIFLEKEEHRRLEELNKLKSYFVSSVSHELRMPLTSVKMFAETLRLGRVRGARQAQEYLHIIEGETNRLARLIENVLDFSKIERGVKEYRFAKTRLQNVIARSVAAMRYQFKSHKANLRVSIPKRLPTVLADADAIEEVIINLLSNALKYSVGKKEVTLIVSQDRSEVSLSVSDRGIGIPKEEIQNLFSPFYRVRDARSAQIGGAGLGLSLVKHIVDAHRGKVTVKSEVGKGSTFTVRLAIDHAENNSHR